MYVYICIHIYKFTYTPTQTHIRTHNRHKHMHARTHALTIPSPTPNVLAESLKVPVPHSSWRSLALFNYSLRCPITKVIVVKLYQESSIPLNGPYGITVLKKGRTTETSMPLPLKISASRLRIIDADLRGHRYDSSCNK